MPKPRTNAGWIAVILIAVVLLPVAYMGAYYGMLESIVRQSLGSQRVDPGYRIRSIYVHHFFWPANQIDRQIRPGKWD